MHTHSYTLAGGRYEALGLSVSEEADLCRYEALGLLHLRRLELVQV